ncbi:unnamed protein product [Absidia cylindrospora]
METDDGDQTEQEIEAQAGFCVECKDQKADLHCEQCARSFAKCAMVRFYPFRNVN